MSIEKKILVVEDDELVQKAIVRWIRAHSKEPISIITTNNLEEALCLIRKKDIDSISIDCEFYENAKYETKGVYCNVLAEESSFTI